MNGDLIFPEKYRLGLEGAQTYLAKNPWSRSSSALDFLLKGGSAGMHGKMKLCYSSPHVQAQRWPLLTALVLGSYCDGLG